MHLAKILRSGPPKSRRSDHVTRAVSSSGLSESMPLYLIVVTNLLPPYRRPLFEHLAATGSLKLQVWVMAMTERNRHWNAAANDRYTKFFADWGLDLSESDGPILHLNPGIIWALLREKPDAVILGGYDSATTLTAAVILRIRSIPMLFWIESTLGDERIVRKLMTPFIRAILRMAIGVIVPGTAAREYVRRLRITEEKIFVAPNSVDVRAFSPRENDEWRLKAKRQLGLADAPVCLYVGR